MYKLKTKVFTVFLINVKKLRTKLRIDIEQTSSELRTNFEGVHFEVSKNFRVKLRTSPFPDLKNS